MDTMYWFLCKWNPSSACTVYIASIMIYINMCILSTILSSYWERECFVLLQANWWFDAGGFESVSIPIHHYIYTWCSVAHPPPPLWMGHGPPPPLWLWGCGGALLVSDAADFLWFLVPPPPCGCVDGSWWWWRCWKYVYKYLCVYEYIYMYMSMMKWICTYNHMYIYVYIYTYVIMFMNMYVYGYVSSPPPCGVGNGGVVVVVVVVVVEVVVVVVIW